MSNRYSVLFCGDIIDGGDVTEVKEKLALLLKQDVQKIEHLFSGKTFVIKKNIDLTTSEKIQRSFNSTGALCHIKYPESATANNDQQESKETLQVVEEYCQNTGSSPEELKSREKFKDAFLRISALSGKFKLVLNGAQKSISKLWADASESIHSDLEVDGMKMLIKNRYFLTSLAAAITISSLLIFVVSYERKSMPLSAENIDKLLNHIEFIEKAFTIEELQNMTKNRNDFLDYVLVHPIKKMGYEFEASINEIADAYLKDNFNVNQLKKVNMYLEIASHEREELFNSGIISEKTQKRLDAVSKKIGN